MLQSSNLILPLLITFMFWSCCSLNGVVSDPQANLLKIYCNPFNDFFVTSLSIFNENLNATFRDIREQISNQNKHFATSQQQQHEENPIITLFQCRNYLPKPDCVACFDAAAGKIRSCIAAIAPGAHVVYDGCFLRYNSNGFFDETTTFLNFASCGNQTTGGEATIFTTSARKVLMNLQTTTPKIPSFFAATKMNVSNNGVTIYAFAQCIETATTNGCLDCLKSRYNSMETCLPFSEGRAFDAGCFLRYSTTSFFNYNHAIDITPTVKKGSSKKGAIIGGVVGGVALVLILLALFALIRRPRRNNRFPIGDITGAIKLKGLATYTYNDLVFATKNFREANKIGQGGFGTVYKGTLKNGKVVAVKKLTLQETRKIEEDFESEVELISNVHHRNLVRLLGYCSEGHERILIYEYMKNGSLDMFLFGKNKCSLKWKQRYNIILGVARGLTYLHEEFHVRIIHRDIKTNNILLDDDLQLKLADFGLARLLPQDKSHLNTKVAGTFGYTAPEYAIHGKLSEKADIYSYGVVILEIISGQKSTKLKLDKDGDAGAFLLQKAWKLYEDDKHSGLADEALDPRGYDTEEVKKIVEIALLCTQASADMRPTMSEIVVMLQKKDLLENMRPTMPILIETD